MTELTHAGYCFVCRDHLVQDLGARIVDYHRKKRLHQGLRGTKGSGWACQKQTPEHIVGTKNGAMTIRRLEPKRCSETSLLLGMQGVPSDLVPNAPRRGRRQKHRTPAPAFPPVHENQTDGESGSSSDSSSWSSSSTQAPSGIPQHGNTQAQAQTCQPQTVMGANVAVVPASTVLPAVTQKAQIRSSTPTKRAAEPTTQDCASTGFACTR